MLGVMASNGFHECIDPEWVPRRVDVVAMPIMRAAQIPQLVTGCTTGIQDQPHDASAQEMTLCGHIRMAEDLPHIGGFGHEKVIEIGEERLLPAATAIALEDDIGIRGR